MRPSRQASAGNGSTLDCPPRKDRLDTFELLVADWFERAPIAPTPRRVRTAAIPGKADAVIGMRRSGKSWLLLGELFARTAAGLPRARTLYASLEDERLGGVRGADLGRLVDAWWRRYPEAAANESWLVLDEVQNAPGWERFVRRMLDRGGLRIAVTGSSAGLLSGELATAMRGRSLVTEVLPFGFDEVLAHRGVAVPRRWPVGDRTRAVLARSLDRYLEEGGFPEILDRDGAERTRILRDYVDVVLFRDVVERHAGTNVPALRALVRRLCGRPASTFTVHRFHADLRSQGIGVSKDTLHAAVSHVEDAYLAFRVPIDSESERVRASNPHKTYPIDPGLARVFAARAEVGHLLETVVYLELRRRGGEIAWARTRSGFEVDFVIRHPGGTAVVQACADPTGPARERELRALAEVVEELDLDAATVVTLHHSETLELGGRTVEMIPAWRWLLEGGR